MTSVTQAKAVQILHNSGFSFFTLKTFSDLFGIPQNRRLYQLLESLISHTILQKLEKNKYYLIDAPQNPFSLANFIYSPSYISFESALNFHGILSQFPYLITSVTTKRNTIKDINTQSFSFDHVSPKLFIGFTQIDGNLVAEPEKALLDQAYFFLKGLKSLSIDEYDLSKLSKSQFIKYSTLFPKSVYTLLKPHI